MTRNRLAESPQRGSRVQSPRWGVPGAEPPVGSRGKAPLKLMVF